MKIRWTNRALADLDNIHAWLSTIERAKPGKTILRIRDAAALIQRLGDIGRPSPVAGLRELSVPNAPYVIVYDVGAEAYQVSSPYITWRKIARKHLTPSKAALAGPWSAESPD